jgi:5-formyltetrahydrofolate cyclo-ligase
MTGRGAKGEEEVSTRKRQIRRQLLTHRSGQRNKRDLSNRILERLVALPEFLAAQTVSVYVSTAAEVQTDALIRRCWQAHKRIAVPCCVDNELQMFQLQSMDELAPGTMGILEPSDRSRERSQRWIEVSQVDLFVVPGVAFDKAGGRLGLGKGYYDRLLTRSAGAAPTMALAFECQLIEQVPMGPQDVFLDAVITERAVHRRAGG